MKKSMLLLILSSLASLLAAVLVGASPTAGASVGVQEPAPVPCGPDSPWNLPVAPRHVFGNTYSVGVCGLASILITGPDGHVLIDGGLEESAPLIAANIEKLGFQIKDVALILSSHAHFDHVAGLAELQRRSGARVAASPASAAVLRRGESGPEDPQFGELRSFPPLTKVDDVADREVLELGTLRVTAHFTPGHTPGGTSWAWRSCEGERCLDIVYADSLTPVSAEGFRFSAAPTYPGVLADFERSFARIEDLPCNILLTPHPSASDLAGRFERREQGDPDALVDADACRRYVAVARDRLATRLEVEGSNGNR